MSGTTLDRVALVAIDAARLADFYVAAFGFSIVLEDHDRVRLGLGRQLLDLLSVPPRGKSCPEELPGWSPLFQHIAIVAADMTAAFDRLSQRAGWRTISKGGPQRLPRSSGGVTAFKFRDPEGHPLELLGFPEDATPRDWQAVDAAGPCLGFDHSAISVADTARSVAFYEKLGLSASGRSVNTGLAQARLDGIDDPRVEVTALAPGGGPTPHVELLCYRGDYPRDTSRADVFDGVASRLIFSVEPAVWRDAQSNAAAEPMAQPDGSLLLRDPDGHVLQLFAVDDARLQ